MTNKLLKSLLIKSAQVQSSIDEENRFSKKDWIKILRLKKLRLKIKDKILSLTNAHSRKLQAKRLTYNN